MHKQRILYILDDAAYLGRYQEEIILDTSAEEVVFCPLTINLEQKDYLAAKLAKIKPRIKIEVLDFCDIFNKKAFLVKDNYVKFISDFGDLYITRTKTIREYFKYPFGNFSAWWFSSIAEKNTLKTESYHRLVKLLSLLDCIKISGCQQIWLDISDDAIAHLVIKQAQVLGLKIFDLRKTNIREMLSYIRPFFTSVKSLFGFTYLILKAIYIKIVMRNLKARKKVLGNSDFALVTYFPLADKARLKDSVFINKYYEPLHTALKRDYQGRFFWLAHIFYFKDYNFRKSVKLGRDINTWGECLYFWLEWYAAIDVFITLAAHLCISVKFLFRRQRLAESFVYPENGINLWSLYEDEWFASFCGKNLLEGILYYRIFKNLLRRLKPGAAVIYTAEMQPWEKSLVIAAQENAAIKTIAVQHTIVPLLLLNYFNDKNELLPGDNVHRLPKPDYLACVGRIPFDIFKEWGWPCEKLFILGAMRFHHLRGLSAKGVDWMEREDSVVAALPLMYVECREFLLYLYYAFKDQRGMKVYIKSHPACPIDGIVDSMQVRLSSDIFNITDKPLSEILPTAKAVLVSESSSALEAAAYHCPIVIPRMVNTVDMSPLSGISGLGIYVNNAVELRETVTQILKSKSNPIPFEKYDLLIKDYLELHDDDNDYLKCLQETVSKRQGRKDAEDERSYSLRRSGDKA